jgi:hypothetical protein
VQLPQQLRCNAQQVVPAAQLVRIVINICTSMEGSYELLAQPAEEKQPTQNAERICGMQHACDLLRVNATLKDGCQQGAA